MRKNRIYITGMDFCIKKYGEVFEGLGEQLPYKTARRMDSFSLMLAHAAGRVLGENGLKDMDGRRCGAVFNTYWGPLRSTEEFFTSLIRDGALNVSPALFPSLVTNAALGRICALYKIRYSTAFLLGAAPMEYALELMRKKEMPYMLIGECDELFKTSIKACRARGILSREGTVFPESGLACSHGYAVFLLQRAEQDGPRPEQVYGEVLSSASIYAPVLIRPMETGEAAKRFGAAITTALEEAGVDKKEVTELVSFSGGRGRAAQIEEAAFEAVFGGGWDGIGLARPKAEYGEVFGEGASLALKAGTDIIRNLAGEEHIIVCCSYQPETNLNVTVLKGGRGNAYV